MNAYQAAQRIASQLNDSLGIVSSKAQAHTAEWMESRGYGNAPGIVWEGSCDWVMGEGQFFDVPDGFWVEPYSHYALSVYRDEQA